MVHFAMSGTQLMSLVQVQFPSDVTGSVLQYTAGDESNLKPVPTPDRTGFAESTMSLVEYPNP